MSEKGNKDIGEVSAAVVALSAVMGELVDELCQSGAVNSERLNARFEQLRGQLTELYPNAKTPPKILEMLLQNTIRQGEARDE
ncbi:hypothetical protein [Acidovorax sp. A1169]|uniref:hypothetical protein n=1 Tax=Acidovorax sp. A1169 TaxID=3059524 RepID=UPI002737FE18|nr:hypothetical protein [Acidovorax sp. A1169]MDP4076246.1 hypothetical protein [Acidovorax sp. A1169]